MTRRDPRSLNSLQVENCNFVKLSAILANCGFSDSSTLTTRQIENCNLVKLSAILADCGYNTMRLSADWNGADLIAEHIDGRTLQVLLSGRFGFWRKYCGRNLHMAFPANNHDWFLYPHDELLKSVLPRIEHTDAWQGNGSEEPCCSWPNIPDWAQNLLEAYRVNAVLDGGQR